MITVRIGVIGMGNMGRFHSDYLLNGEIKDAVLAAVSDSRAVTDEKFAAVRKFETSEQMIRSGEVDAVLIATPHFLHTTIGVDALQNGLHVLVEKPISVHKRDCERLLAAHKDDKLVFAAMFQQRVEPRFRKIKELVASGTVGEIVRTNWIVTDWYRTEAYYSSGGWRATWKGEGGGVLLNQCPHNLDLLQWICGRPVRVTGFCQLGRFHNIEVEDNVTAYLEYGNGGTGVFVTSTGESPGSNRFEIVGDRGRLVLENGKITLSRNQVSMFEFSRTSTSGFARPEVAVEEIVLESSTTQHREITQNFVDAILKGERLIAPASEGLWSVELANAILYSSLMEQPVTLPLDGTAYEQKLNQLIASSRFEKKSVKKVAEDFAKSFGR